MEKAKKAFVLYTNYFEQIKILSNEQCGVLLKSIFAYECGEELPEMDGMVTMAFSFIRSQLDRDAEKYDEIAEKRRIAGAKGGRPKKEKQEELQESKKSKQNQKVFEKPVKDKDKDTDKDINTLFVAPGDSHPMPIDPFEQFADVAAIPLNDGTDWRMPLETYEEFVKLYPNVDVKQEMNAMRGWIISNPTRRKTKTGVKRFINNWLSSEQNKPNRYGGGRKQVVPEYMTAQQEEQATNTDTSEIEEMLAKMGGIA